MRGHVRKYSLKDGETRWAAVVYRGKRVAANGCLQDSYRWIRGFATQKAANAELTKVLHSMTNGTYLEPTKQTLAEYLERWLATIKGNLAPKTFERYEQIIRVNINPRLGPIRLIELQPMQIAEFYTWSTKHGNLRFKTGLNTRTVLHIHRLLRKALKQAVRWSLRMKNPTDDVDAPSPGERETKTLEEAGAARLIVASEETRLFLPILAALCTGIRRGEMLGLRWSDLDLDHEKLTVNQSVSQTKEKGIFFKSPKRTKSKRTMTIPPMLVEAFRGHRELQLKAKELFGPDYHDLDLVICQPDGSPWSPDGFTKAYKDFARQYVGDIRFHDLRHTHASELLRRGTPIKTVCERLGHANAFVTLMTYAHVMTGDDQKASDMVQNVLFTEVQKQRQAEVK